MKKIALLMVIGLLSTAAVCMFAPQASGAAVSNAYTKELLPDVYRVEQTLGSYGYAYVSQTGGSYYYPYECKYYVKGSSEETSFLSALNSGNQSLMPASTGGSGQIVNVYVFIFGDPSNYTVYSGGPGKALTESDLFKRSNVRFYLYSGQDVKLTLLFSSSSMRFGNGNYYDYVEPGVNELTVMIRGEYRLYDTWYYGGMTLFATFSIEYNDPPTNVAVYGYMILVLAAACMGAMVFFSRGQKIN